MAEIDEAATIAESSWSRGRPATKLRSILSMATGKRLSQHIEACTEVVDGQRNPERELRGSEPRVAQRVRHGVDDAGLGELTEREVHRELEGGGIGAGIAPPSSLRARFAQDPVADGDDEACLLGEVDEVIGGEQGTNGLAVASLVLGIIWLYWLGSLLATIFGAVAIRQINASGGRQGGKGLAVAGLVLGIVGLSILALLFIAGPARLYSAGPRTRSCPRRARLRCWPSPFPPQSGPPKPGAIADQPDGGQPHPPRFARQPPHDGGARMVAGQQ